jgi:hypothetical protein
MTTQSSDHPNAYKDLDIENLKIYSMYMASFVEAKIASYVESKGERRPVQKVTLYRYRYPGGPRAIARFPTNVRYCIIFSILGLAEIISKIPDYASCTVLHGLKVIIISIDDFIKQKYDFFSDVYSSKSNSDFSELSENNLPSKRSKKMLREWLVVAIDYGNNEFINKCPFLNLDFPNIVLYERSKNKPENLESLLIEAVPEVAKIYKAYKIIRKKIKDNDEVKNHLKIYFNEHMSSFNLVKEKYLNNKFIYSSMNENALRRDFCGRLLSQVIADFGYSQPGAQRLFSKMREIERANK